MRTTSRARALGLLALALSLTVAAARAADEAGDPLRGAALFQGKCFACHALETDRVGPRLGGVLGRAAGAVPGFAYSPALAGAGFAWDRAALDRWLAGPRAFLPGARMPFFLPSAEDRRDVIEYLATQPAALP